MNIDDLKKTDLRLDQEVFNLGFAAGLNHTRNAERNRVREQQAEAAELIANAGSERQAPQINSPVTVVERARAFREGVAQSRKLRSEIARHLAL